jgi:hypothetical protein
MKHSYCKLGLTRDSQAFDGKRGAFSANGAGTIWIAILEKKKSSPML